MPSGVTPLSLFAASTAKDRLANFAGVARLPAYNPVEIME
jgi:hypothetical protein